MNKNPLFFIFIFFLGFFVCSAVDAYVDKPPLGWTTRAEIDRVKDGDTLVVRISKTIDIRLLDCWAEEIRGRKKTKKGLEAKRYLNDLVGDKKVTLYIPAEEGGNISKIWTLSRAKGRIWIDGEREKDVSELMVEAGFATKEKIRK